MSYKGNWHFAIFIMQGYWLRTDRNLSVSSHLTPDPERRLSRMLETLRQKRNMADFKLAAAAAISALEMFAVMPSHAVQLNIFITDFGDIVQTFEETTLVVQ